MSRTRSVWLARTVGAVVVSLICAAFMGAQEFRGLISGQVTDPSGAVVPNATITALREGTQ